MSIGGVTEDEFNTNKVAITQGVADNLSKQLDDVTLTLQNRRRRRRQMTSKTVMFIWKPQTI
jgi:hypothetical protein